MGETRLPPDTPFPCHPGQLCQGKASCLPSPLQFSAPVSTVQPGQGPATFQASTSPSVKWTEAFGRARPLRTVCPTPPFFRLLLGYDSSTHWALVQPSGSCPHPSTLSGEPPAVPSHPTQPTFLQTQPVSSWARAPGRQTSRAGPSLASQRPPDIPPTLSQPSGPAQHKAKTGLCRPRAAQPRVGSRWSAWQVSPGLVQPSTRPGRDCADPRPPWEWGPGLWADTEAFVQQGRQAGTTLPRMSLSKACPLSQRLHQLLHSQRLTPVPSALSGGRVCARARTCTHREWGSAQLWLLGAGGWRSTPSETRPSRSPVAASTPCYHLPSGPWLWGVSGQMGLWIRQALAPPHLPLPIQATNATRWLPWPCLPLSPRCL